MVGYSIVEVGDRPIRVELDGKFGAGQGTDGEGQL